MHLIKKKVVDSGDVGGGGVGGNLGRWVQGLQMPRRKRNKIFLTYVPNYFPKG